MKDLAPIVLFVYNRPDHTLKTLHALQKNNLAIDSDLFIYSDGAKDSYQKEKVEEVRELICNLSGFKNVTVIKQKENLGLAESIIKGVSKIVDIYGKVIVLEDDIVTNPYFLSFMNKSLSLYEEDLNVWHISGWNYPIKNNDTSDSFFWRGMNCWGWATWHNRWTHFEKKPSEILNSWDKSKISRFNIEGTNNFFSQIESNHNGRLNTWAVFWYSTIFNHNGLCLNPYKSLVENVGNDGSGENCGSVDIYRNKNSDFCPEKYPDIIIESKLAVSAIKKFFKWNNSRNIFVRIFRKCRRVFGL
ncbi:glycosyltransferase [Moritella sp. F3]|uniref:glycosyltransferase n=1 Tax=Moritella sp. F3 TaxID=2718882 RepID=UPI0018E199D1|nr:glycosyltransferase [Moritella sp. F3]GIC77265.1 glycosyl transferase [Moritella sp. F1]GIC83207.1 glycosyl transferase [Moritella sp. F3]